MQRLLARLNGTLTPATVTYRYTATVFESAMRSRLIARTPCGGIKLPKIVKARVVPLSTDELLSIADGVPSHLRALVFLAAGIGMRQGELFGLTHDHVMDFLRRTITVDRQLLHTSAEGYHFGPRETETSNRVIPCRTSSGASCRHTLHSTRSGTTACCSSVDAGLRCVGGRSVTCGAERSVWLT